MELKDSIAVVTGVSKGIGLAIVKQLLEREVIVAGWGRSKPDLDHKNFHFFKVDIKEIDQVNNAFAKTTEALGNEISILINNAGLGYESLFEDLDVEKWHDMFRTNVDGIFYCSRLVIPGMKKKDHGHIVNISSIAGNLGIPGMAAYCGTKHAVRGISQSMYKELRNFGIKVTCIYPGSVKTNFFDKIDSVETNDSMMMPEDIASTIMHVLLSPPNYHHVDIEVRPLRPRVKSLK
jgi:NADP-dependent 3-hydroxy acid dehydrogenase YdfG